MSSTRRVGFLGVGQMGRPMVERLHGAGVPVIAFARRREVLDELRDEGVEPTTTMREILDADVVVLCVFSDAQLRSALELGTGDLLSAVRPGTVVVNHVTGNPALAGEIAAALPDGASILDAPVSGTADEIRNGALTVLAGGDANALERARPTLETYADPIIHVGPHPGDGQRTKLINNLLFTANLGMALDAARLAESMGLEPAEVARVLAACSGRSYALALLEHLPPATTRDMAGPYLAKDVAVIRQVADDLDIDLGTLGDVTRWADG